MVGRDPEVAQLVAALVGTWVGTGEGGYPTIEPFSFRERTIFKERPNHPAVHYKQKTWRQTPEGEIVSHKEKGLLRISSDHTLTLDNIQGARAETMVGTWEATNSTWTIRLRSTDYAGDGRVIASTRAVEIGPDHFNYELTMETAATAEMHLHVQAQLRRQPPG